MNPSLRLGLLGVLGLGGGAVAFGTLEGSGGQVAATDAAHALCSDPAPVRFPDIGGPPPVLAPRGRAAMPVMDVPAAPEGPAPASTDAAGVANPSPVRRRPPFAPHVVEDGDTRLRRTIMACQAEDGRVPADPALRPCARGEVALALRDPEEPSDPPAPKESPVPPPVFDPRDVLSTAYGVEAVMAGWYTNRSEGAEGRFLSKALAWLKRHQNDLGSFGSRTAPTTLLADARATAALVRLYGATEGEWIRETVVRALGALDRRFDPSRGDALSEDDPSFPEAALSAADACGTAALIAAHQRKAGRAVTLAPPIGLVRTLAAWADEPAPVRSALEVHRAMARILLGVDPRADASIQRIVARLRNEGGEPVVPVDPLELDSAAVVMRTSSDEEYGAWREPLWSRCEAGLPASKDPCDPRLKDGTVPDVRTLSLQAMARSAFGWWRCDQRGAPVDAMDEARRALRPPEAPEPEAEPDEK